MCVKANIFSLMQSSHKERPTCSQEDPVMTGAICSTSEGPDHRALLHHYYLLLLIEIISHSGMHMFALHFPPLQKDAQMNALAPSFIHYVCSLQKIPFQKTCVDLRCAGTSRAVSPSSAMRRIDLNNIMWKLIIIVYTHKYGVV